jgi:6-phosphogluconolactonase
MAHGLPLPAIHVAPVERLAERFAGWCADWAGEADRRRGRFSLAIPGGSVAASFLPMIARAPLPWKSVHVFWVDERVAPLESGDSNAGSAFRLLDASGGQPPATWHPMYDGAEDPERAARGQARSMEALLGRPPTLDVVLLGVGEDGHVCSLFPGHPAADAEEWVVVVDGAPKPPPARLTLTYPVLRAADRVVVAAMGSAKAPIIGEAMRELPTSSLPVARAIRDARTALVLLDPAAAERLGAVGSSATFDR